MNIPINPEYLKELEQSARKLAALESAGVDNWDGYDFALEEIRKEEALKERMEVIFNDICTELAEGAYEPSERGAGFTFDTDSMKMALNIMLDNLTLKENINE